MAEKEKRIMEKKPTITLVRNNDGSYKVSQIRGNKPVVTVLAGRKTAEFYVRAGVSLSEEQLTELGYVAELIIRA